MIYNDIIVVGSGPSGTNFSFSALEIGKKILMIDQGYTNKEKKNLNIQNKYFHPRLIDPKNSFINKNFKLKNKIVEKNFSSVGSLAIGGLSNVWGGGYWEKMKTGNKNNDYKRFLNKNFRIYTSNKRDTHILTKYLNKNKNNSDLEYRTTKLISYKNKSKIYNSKDIINDLKKFPNFKYKNNSFIETIDFINGYYVLTDDNKQKYKCKKLILACGTLGSTRLVLKLKNLKQIKQRLYHNISYGFLGFLKKKIKYQEQKKHVASSVIIFKDSNYNCKVSGSIGRYNLEFAKLINIKYPIIGPFINSILSFFKNRIIIGNLFFPSEFSNSEIFLDTNNNLNIHGKLNNKLIKLNNKLIKVFFKSNLSFYKIYFQILPLGSDAHYSSTISQNSSVVGLKTNKNGELNKYRNLYIVDGSILSSKHLSLFPTFSIMQKSYELAKKILN